MSFCHRHTQELMAAGLWEEDDETEFNSERGTLGIAWAYF